VHHFRIDSRRAARAAAVALLAFAGACESPAAAGPLQTRLFKVAQVDDQLLPAHHECPAPVEGMLTGTHFVEGELTLYPEHVFSWRYTYQQYVSHDGIDEAWIEPVLVTGSYTLRGDSLHLTAGDVVREGRISGDIVELSETIPCRYPAGGDVTHEAEVFLTEDTD
jgi:hypothetical protein